MVGYAHRMSSPCRLKSLAQPVPLQSWHASVFQKQIKHHQIEVQARRKLVVMVFSYGVLVMVF